MVLPAPATPEGQAGRPAWLDRLRKLLGFGRRGVLILVPDVAIELDAAIQCELEPAALDLLTRLQTEAIGFESIFGMTDTDAFLLAQARRLSDWPALREQALRMRSSGPLVRALFASERAAFG